MFNLGYVYNGIVIFHIFWWLQCFTHRSGWDDHVGSVFLFHSSLTVILSHRGFLYNSLSLSLSLIYLSRWRFPKRNIRIGLFMIESTNFLKGPCSIGTCPGCQCPLFLWSVNSLKAEISPGLFNANSSTSALV